MTDLTVLRSVAHRLMSVPVKELPPVAAYLASSIIECRSILSSALNAKGSATDTESFLLVQKLKTRITSLLQDRTVEGRWTAVVLVKAAVEAGQWEILHSSANWVRNLLSILGVRIGTSSIGRASCLTLSFTETRSSNDEAPMYHLSHQNIPANAFISNRCA